MNLKSYTKGRFVLDAFAAFACAVFTAHAETVDLAGSSLTVADIAAVNDYVNTSDTAATLTLDTNANVTFGGTVAGNIAIVKKGSGTVTFANDNTHTGGITLNEGFIAVDKESRLGTGTVIFDGGGIKTTASFLQTKVVFDFEYGRHGTVHTPEGVTFSVSNKLFRTGVSGSFTKTGAGTLELAGAFKSYNSNAHWIIDEGTLNLAVGDMWGSHASETTVTVEIRENAILRAGNHTPLPNVVMRGGMLYHNANTVKIEGKPSDSDSWTCFSFRQSMTVLPSESGKPSRVIAEHCYSGHADLIPLFNVAEGAELRIEAKLERGRVAGSSAVRVPGGFVKTGKGTMTLCQPCDFDGGNVRVEDGSLRIKCGASLTPNTKLTVSSNARIELDDGAALDCPVLGESKAQADVLADADVWVDATAIPGEYAQQVESVPNLGKAGGDFGKITVKNPKDTATAIPNAPVLRASILNNRPALYFDKHAMLMLDSYTNKTKNITVCAVGRRLSYTKWYGYLSMKPDNEKNDDGCDGRLHTEDNGDKIRVFSRNSSAALTLAGSVTDDSQFFDFYESSDTVRAAFQYTTNGTVTATNTTDLSSLANSKKYFNIELVGLGGRLGPNRSGQYLASNLTSSNRMFDGYIGELLVWSRLLTDAEKAEVSAYLKSKWFGVEPETATAEDAPLLENAPVTVDVLGGMGGVSKVAGGLIKDGEGTLVLGEAEESKDVRINEGALALLPTSLVHKVSVWVDATDSSTLTVENGKVVAIRNKGSCGGVFRRNDIGTAVPDAPVLSSINGLQSISFDGNSALALQNSYSNTNPDRRLQIFMVGQRSASAKLESGGKGRYSGAYCIASTKQNSQDYLQPFAPHSEEQIVDNQLDLRFTIGGNQWVPIKTTDLSFYPAETPFLFSSVVGIKGASFAMERSDGIRKSATVNVSTIDTPAPDVDIVQLGGRLGAYGAAQWIAKGNSGNRMWLGSVGEFIVCDVILSTPEQKALQDYLRAKWFNGNANAEKPVALGTTIAPSLPENVNLSMAEGTKFESHVDTLSLGSLEVEGSATFARGGVTESSKYAMFNVGGDVDLPSAMTFLPLSLPDSNFASILSGVKQSASSIAWTVGDGTSSKWKVSSTSDGFAMSKAGMAIVIR